MPQIEEGMKIIWQIEIRPKQWSTKYYTKN